MTLLQRSAPEHIIPTTIYCSAPDVLTECRLVQEVQLCVEGLELRVLLLDDADDEVQQRLLSVCGFGVQQLGVESKKQYILLFKPTLLYCTYRNSQF